MPVYVYDCHRGHRFERMVLSAVEGVRVEDPEGDWLSLPHTPDVIACVCGAPAVRRGVYALRVVGPVHSDMERFENALLDPGARKHGTEVVHEDGSVEVLPPARFKSAKDVERWEAEHNLARVDSDSAECRIMFEAQAAEAETLEGLSARAGKEAAYNHIRRTDVMDVTGWDTTRYNRWKEMTDAATAKLADGTFAAPGAALAG